jgi:predicted enzyme related to lactoylglutathione lyase
MKRFRGAALALTMAAGLAALPGAHGAWAADPAPLTLSFLKFNVSDLPKMQDFYMKAFGMRQQKRLENPGGTEVILTTDKGLDLALVYSKSGKKLTLGDANGPIGFYLKDVDDAYARAMAAGATSRVAPRSGPGSRVALVLDPEGHEIELLHLD